MLLLDVLFEMYESADRWCRENLTGRQKAALAVAVFVLVFLVMGFVEGSTPELPPY